MTTTRSSEGRLPFAGVQKLFWRIITHPLGVADFLAGADDETRSQIEAVFTDSPTFPRGERLDIYAQGYFFRHLDVLKELFPIVAWRLGKVGFHNMVTHYLLAHPSDNPDLGHLGFALPTFLVRHSASVEAPELPDIAVLELAIQTALDARDGTPLTPLQLGSVPQAQWPELRFAGAPHCKLLDSSWSYEALRDAERAGLTPSEELSRQARLSEPVSFLIWRSGFSVLTRRLERGEAAMLRAAIAGTSFGDLCSLAEGAGLEPKTVVEHLLRWTTDGVIERSHSEH
jgi:hypothetical protein